jgi:hypothetical protein
LPHEVESHDPPWFLHIGERAKKQGIRDNQCRAAEANTAREGEDECDRKRLVPQHAPHGAEDIRTHGYS